jgi:CRP-like cAMP-binding protein
MGDHVCRTHDVADDADAKFYWILSGAVEVVKPSALEGEGEVSSSLKSGDFVGDLAFIPREKQRVR